MFYLVFKSYDAYERSRRVKNMPIDLFESTMAITLSTSTIECIKESNDYIEVRTKFSIEYGQIYWLNPKGYDSLEKEAKECCRGYYDFKKRNVYNRPGCYGFI